MCKTSAIASYLQAIFSHLLSADVRLLRAQRANLKSRRDDMTIAPGKRGTSAARGRPTPQKFPSAHPMGRGIKGEGLLELTGRHLRHNLKDANDKTLRCPSAFLHAAVDPG